MKTVLVTGAGGLIGAEVLHLLAARSDVQVVALDWNAGGGGSSGRVRWVKGDLCDVQCRASALSTGVDAVMHLAAVPGGAAEADPVLSQRINIEATLSLLREAANSSQPPRVVYASTIAVFGDRMPASGVGDETPLEPRMIYGAHKAMVETMVGALSRRGAIDGISLRLPGILARPKGPSGLKSAFMSELFHDLRESRPFVSPISPKATMWLMSVKQCAANLILALDADTTKMPPGRALTLPALRVRMEELVDAVARETGSNAGLVNYDPDEALEKAFGAYPPLATPAAESAGFTRDGNLRSLVGGAFEVMARS